MKRARSTQSTMYVAALLGAGLAGLVIASIPWQLSVLFIALIVSALALVVAKVTLRPLGSVTHAYSTSISSEEDPRLKLPRLLYYMGAATIGLLTIRPALTFTASDWIFFLSFGLTCLVLLTYGVARDYLVPPAITIGVVLFSVGGLLSSFQALAPLQSVSIVVRLLYLTVVWFWLGTIVLQNSRHVEIAVVAWVSSAALSSAGAVVQFLEGDVIPGGYVAWGRMTGFTPHTNNLAGLAATAFVPALMVAVDAPTRRLRWLGVGVVALVGAGLLLSGSVGGLLAAGVSMVFWLALRGVSLRLVLSLGAFVATALVLMSATGSTVSPAPIERLQRVTSPRIEETGGQGSVFTRVAGYQEAWRRIREEPLIGVGLDEASNQQVLGEHLVHNIFINPWFSAGLFGLIGIVLILGGAFTTGRFVVRGSPSAERRLAVAMLSSYVAFVVFAMGEPILFVRYGWFPAAMLVALHAQYRRAQAPVVRRGQAVRPAVMYSAVR